MSYLTAVPLTGVPLHARALTASTPGTGASSAFSMLAYRQINGFAANQQEYQSNMGLSFDGRTVLVGKTYSGSPYSLDITIIDGDSTITTVTETGLSSSEGSTMCAFDSDGNFYFSLKGTGLLRVIAAGGTSIATELTGTSSSNNFRSFSEDNDGDLYTSEYPNGSEVWRKPSGGSWAKIVTEATGYVGSVDPIPNTHTHRIVYDKWRDILVATVGDASGSLSKLSDDKGASWVNWDGTEKTVGIVIGEKAVLYVTETSSDYKVYRQALSGTGISAYNNGVGPVVAFDPTDPPLNYTTQNEFGFSWWGFTDHNGNFVIPMGNVSTGTGKSPLLLGFDENGKNATILDEGYADLGVASSYCEMPTLISEQITAEVKRFGVISGGPYTEILTRVAGEAIDVNPASGSWQSGAIPIVTDGLASGMKFRLLGGDSVKPIVLGGSGSELDLNGYNGTAITGAVAAANKLQTFNSASLDAGWSESKAASVTSTQETGIYAEGTSSRRYASDGSSGGYGTIVASGAYNANNQTYPDKFSKTWFRTTLIGETTGLINMRAELGFNFVQLQIDATGQLQIRVRSTSDSTGDWIFDTRYSITADEWYKFILHVHSGTNPYVTLYVQEGVSGTLQHVFTTGHLDPVAYSMLGDVTTGGITRIIVGGSYSPTGPFNYYLDQVVASHSWPEDAAAVIS